jgi:hypothetical protein
MENYEHLFLKVALLAGVIAMFAPSAQANLSYPVTFSVQCGTELVQQDFSQSVSSQVEILDPAGRCVAKVFELNWDYAGDPSVNLHFSVQAGDMDTTFTVSSSVVSFAALPNPQAVASSSLTLTDTDGNGATLVGLEGGNKSYKAVYNGNVAWASLNDGFSVTDPFDGYTESDRQPTNRLQTITDTLTSIQSEYSFTLSAWDEASGTSTFNVNPPVIPPAVPEPLTMIAVLMGLAGVGRYVRERSKSAA